MSVLAQWHRVRPVTLPQRPARSLSIPPRDVIFDYGPALRGHANGMIFTLLRRERRERF